jgi:hypothetical protein
MHSISYFSVILTDFYNIPNVNLTFHCSCPSKVRTRLELGMSYDKKYDMDNQQIEIVNRKHNHEIITGRRKKGTLKKSVKRNLQST